MIVVRWVFRDRSPLIMRWGSDKEVKNCDSQEKVRSFEESVSFPGKKTEFQRKR